MKKKSFETIEQMFFSKVVAHQGGLRGARQAAYTRSETWSLLAL